MEREVLVKLGASAVADERGLGAGPVPPNGGFPLPPADVVTRVINAIHEICGQPTEVRIPAHLEPRAVQSVVCGRCAERYEPISVEQVDVILPAPASRRVSRRRDPEDVPAWRNPETFRRLAAPQGLGWRVLSVPLAAVAVVAGLLMIQGTGSEEAATPFDVSAPAAPQEAPGQAAAGAGAAQTPTGDARLVRGSSFSLALPAGWKEIGDGATFAAESPRRDAEVKLWVSNEASLPFAEFEAQSLAQLESVAGEAQVVERRAGSTPDGTIVRLAAKAPAGAPAHEVTLRAAGPYRYYLSTTLEPGAPRAAANGVDLVHGSFTPVVPAAAKDRGN